MLCYHCGNTTPHTVHLQYEPEMLFEVWGEDEYYAPFRFFAVSCDTCHGLNLLGDFLPNIEKGDPPINEYPRLYPKGPDINPPFHTVDRGNPIPEQVLEVYRKAWPLRHTNPAAFANQMRRTLEYVCTEQGASGDNLYEQLHSLAERHVLPKELVETASLIREVGNRGSHADHREVDIYDAELIDELFKLMIRYIYLGPAHVRRLRQRLSV